MLNYPAPCDTCTKERCGGVKCDEWVAYYRIHQKWINSKALQIAHTHPAAQSDAIHILHPDEYRRYMTAHPCEGCFVKNICDTPCPRYLRWYDERMAYARKKVGL
jgi:hypothetical protein